MTEQRALAAVEQAGIVFRRVTYGPARTLAESAVLRGVQPQDIVKTIVVRRGDGDFLFVLVPGDRTIAWPKLRRLLNVQRLSMPDAATAKDVTGYERGTITPFGSTQAWPVIADERVAGRQVSMGGGTHGVSFTFAGDDVIRVLDATVADITEPEG